ncbi:MAG: xanthine dehydrogenase family protein molybdopterin-binding subunit [Gammaproteobacteria bacterium]|nr:xanthine dehydrogenase family protein molybdopterin-binding subunit [Gammaproteobacteria bacterium]
MDTVNQDRRTFLKKTVTAAAGLTLAVYLPRLGADSAGPGKTVTGTMGEAGFAPNAFVRIGTDNTVTVIVKHLEMGQGTYTGLSTLVAEELDAAWSQVKAEGAPADAARYNNLFWGPVQGTGGSTAIANSFEQMRKAGAAAREMLVNAAAEKWQVAADTITVHGGVVVHEASQRSATFGELAELAARQPVPADVILKDPSEFRLIGKTLPRKDSAVKARGQATYTQDVKLPEMLTAVVAHPPRFGGKVKAFDDSKTRRVKGVVDVVAIPSGVAVLAEHYWAASRGREALNVEWDETGAFKLGSEEILAQYQALADLPGTPARRDGDAEKALADAAQTLRAEYVFPYLAHAAMEPMNCVVNLGANACEVYNGEQLHTADQAAVAKVVGLKPEQVKIKMLFAGGSFGRRANPQSDYVVEAASIAKAINGRAPVKLVWSREDDTRGGYYRPLYYHRLAAGLDRNGNIMAWQHRIVGQSIIMNTPFAEMIKDGIDPTSVEGAANLPYAIPNLAVDLHTSEIGVPVQWWRSVGSTHTAFAVETFFDEIAAKAGHDPVAYRRALLTDHPRHAGVLALAAEQSGWGSPLPKRRGRGIAVHESFNSCVAQAAEVTINDDQTFSIDRVVIAVDCGIAVNPDVIRAQMEGGMGYGLSAALSEKITLKEGRVEQSNFHDYTVLRINQMPDVEVHIVESDAAPSGVGEPATPVIAPAVANALAAATGKRFYELPLSLSA